MLEDACRHHCWELYRCRILMIGVHVVAVIRLEWSVSLSNTLGVMSSALWNGSSSVINITADGIALTCYHGHHWTMLVWCYRRYEGWDIVMSLENGAAVVDSAGD